MVSNTTSQAGAGQGVDLNALLSKGMDKLRERDTLAALVYFEKAVNTGEAPLVCASCFGYCIARERGQLSRGLAMCLESLEKEPGNPVHHLNLARIHLLAGRKEEAVEALRKGAACGANDEVAVLLEEIGPRKPPPVGFFHRDHPVNKYLGIVLGWLGQR